MAPASQPTDKEPVRAAVSARYSSLARRPKQARPLPPAPRTRSPRAASARADTGGRLGISDILAEDHLTPVQTEVRREGRDISQASPA
jgi:hypothetical protein